MSRRHDYRMSHQDHARAIALLCHRDKDFRQVIGCHGLPPMWQRKPGFVTLVHTILEQQVSLASAKAVLKKLRKICTPLNPDKLLALSTAQLAASGFSRQKMRYCRTLAEAISSAELNLRKLHRLDDDSFRKEITVYPGIGPWTADVYLLMALGRPNVWPSGDLALMAATQSLKNLQARPSRDEMDRIGEKWRPYRSSAARILWHHYLNN
ncbi:MAG: DNA-3-methyladenine glycosylase 2 family protein [Gammaproteobacteria bacterium]|nr:DNA-3-methyladenine glycosylase 2 family protein [Gammaproteobacteria bacterium]